MPEETTTSRRPSQEQIVADIRNARKDLDSIEEGLNTTYNTLGISESGGAIVNASWKVAEARMWLGRALATLGEANTSEDNDKAEEPRAKVAPSRDAGDAKTP